jgi:hypothetical protein
MKKLLTFLFLTLLFTTYSQDSYDNYLTPSYTFQTKTFDTDSKINLNLSASPHYGNEPSFPLGLGMILGGSTFIVAGLLTVPDYEVAPDGTTKTKPFWRQGARMLAIVSGAGVLTAGVVISIGGY